MNRTLMDHVRSMWICAGIEQKFWAKAVCTTCYVVNHSPTTALDGKILEEVWSGKPVDYSFLRTFSCDVYIWVPEELRTKLDVRTTNPPIWLKDYVTAYACITEEHEPCTYRESCESNDASQWRASMEEEVKALYKNKTWDLVKLPNGRKAISYKWVYKMKMDTNGKVE
ncbi:hypothetical protein NE237_009896 [Protea cynaroides]|uniref:Uncharacterized protein n=1 Tax=Protea cynaroides TaxID=273540 RepID=A0A9Q0KZI2_9MAGN|nr:hypothetical protein NE237_009896 [Protea cynaroides]